MKYTSDEDKMKVALAEARKAFDIDEVPVGAAIFDKNDNLICANHNRRELDQNPMSHAEILVLEKASQILGTWRLEETTIAVTLEPAGTSIISTGTTPTLFTILFLKNVAILLS